MSITAIVLAGGTSRRFGSDKLAADLGEGRLLLDATLDGLPPSWPIICVGSPRDTAREATWTREDPPLGGPVAAIATGLRCATTDLVVIIAGDMPFAGAVAPQLLALLETRPDVDVVAAADQTGRVNPLLIAARAGALREALPADPGGAAAYKVLARLRVEAVPVPDEQIRDIDTPGDLDSPPA